MFQKEITIVRRYLGFPSSIYATLFYTSNKLKTIKTMTDYSVIHGHLKFHIFNFFHDVSIKLIVFFFKIFKM